MIMVKEYIQFSKCLKQNHSSTICALIGQHQAPRVHDLGSNPVMKQKILFRAL